MRVTEAGMMICYDIRFPELARKLALKAQSCYSFLRNGRIRACIIGGRCLMRRAIENQMFVIACNRWARADDTHFFGHSMIIDPWGEIIAEAGEEETILRAEIDLTARRSVRSKIPVFEDRRPSIVFMEA